MSILLQHIIHTLIRITLLTTGLSLPAQLLNHLPQRYRPNQIPPHTLPLNLHILQLNIIPNRRIRPRRIRPHSNNPSQTPHPSKLKLLPHPSLHLHFCPLDSCPHTPGLSTNNHGSVLSDCHVPHSHVSASQGPDT